MLSNRQLQTWELYATPDAYSKEFSHNIRTQSFWYIAETLLLPHLIGKIKGNTALDKTALLDGLKGIKVKE